MFCEKCGTKKGQSDKFCANCGNSFTATQTPVQQQNVSPAQPTENLKQYDKIGGWLYLVGFGLFISPFIIVYGIFDTLSLVSDGLDEIDSLAPGLAGAIWFELILDTVLFFGVVYLLMLFRARKKEFKKYYVWYLGISLVYVIVDYFLVASLSAVTSEMRDILNQTLEEQISTVARSTISSVIWIAYMLKSKRVKGTFVN